jgi:hypothetical protein
LIPSLTALPALPAQKCPKFDGEVLPNPTEYCHIVGALQYVTLTHPDIAYSVNQLCQHMHTLTSTHWTVAKRVLPYFKGTIDFGLHYTTGELQLMWFSDSNWARNPDDRRFTTSFGIFLGPNLLS